MYNYGIGGQERKQDASEGITEISQNRTLLLEKLTDDPAMRPEIVGDLKTVDEVFAHFKPEKEVEFESEDGSTYTEMLRFRTLGDFGKRGLINQSAALQELNTQYEDFQKFVKQLKSNKILKTLLENPDARQQYQAALRAMIKELEDAE